jgi:hypothetical protein
LLILFKVNGGSALSKALVQWWISVEVVDSQGCSITIIARQKMVNVYTSCCKSHTLSFSPPYAMHTEEKEEDNWNYRSYQNCSQPLFIKESFASFVVIGC